MDDHESLLKRIALLEESEHFFRTLYEKTVDAVVLIDMERGIFDCNPASLSMFRATTTRQLCSLQLTDLSAAYQSGWLPSSELIARHLFEQLAGRVNDDRVRVAAVKVWESEGSWAEFRP